MPSEADRARLIATADMLLDVLGEVRSRQPSTADVRIVESWMARVAGARENLDAITEWSAAEAYPVNALHPAESLRRLFPAGLDGADLETELSRLEDEFARDHRARERESPVAPLTPDELLADVLLGHAGARFRYLDVRSVDAWRREHLRDATNIPLERLAEEAPRTFRKETDLVVYGDDNAGTDAAAAELQRLGFQPPTRIPGGFPWFKRRGWEIETGPSEGP